MSDSGIAPPPTARIKLAALRAAFSDWSFDITAGPGPRCFEARRIGGTGSLYTVASTSARELRRILLDRCTVIKDALVAVTGMSPGSR